MKRSPIVESWYAATCPRCHAKPGEECKTTEGNRAYFHTGRIKAAKRVKHAPPSTPGR